MRDAWRDFEEGTHWGVLLLFGGGRVLSQMRGSTGASRFLAQELEDWVQGAPVLVLLSAAIAVSASCAFMLPAATPPNAIAYGTGHVPQHLMMRCGLVLNAVCILVITAVMYFVM